MQKHDSCHVETVCLLGRQNDDVEYISIPYEPRAGILQVDCLEKATYGNIKAWIWKEFNLKVSSLYIGQIKSECGLTKQRSDNTLKKKGKKPKCPPDKEKAILAAFRHFHMI